MQVNHTGLTITAGGLVATIHAGELITVTALTLDGEELICGPAELPAAYRVHGQAAGITLLHPWANRLGADRYTIGGVGADLGDASGSAGVARDGSGLPIHGLVGARPWEFTAAGASSCAARLVWDVPQGFPFPHVVTVSFAVSGAALTVVTVTTPTGSDRVPVAHGWHPYFRADRAGGVAVELPERTAVALGPDGLPTGETHRFGRLERTLTDEHWDDAVVDLRDGAEARVITADCRICVRSDRGYPCSHVFAPRDAPVVSLEPMTAPVDALRSGAVAWATPDTPHVASFSISPRRT